jgi:hypothetical protein
VQCADPDPAGHDGEWAWVAGDREARRLARARVDVDDLAASGRRDPESAVVGGDSARVLERQRRTACPAEDAPRPGVDLGDVAGACDDP